MQEQLSEAVAVEFDVSARMRDGVVLRADVYRPAGDGPWPVLLTRTPYDKSLPGMSATFDPTRVARRGFVVVVQDTRGRFRSDGEWTPFLHEREDGFDTVEWAARLPGSNGRVGMYGGSYCGNTQWAAAVEQPPSLGAIAPLETWSEPLDGMLSRGGALELGLVAAWTLQTGLGHLARLPLSDGERAQRVAAMIDDYDALLTDGYWGLPVHELPVLQAHDAPDIGTFAMLVDSDVPSRTRVDGRHERVTVPVLSIGGWHDLFVQGTIDNWCALRALGRPARLVMGPWTHGNPVLTDLVGELSHGLLSNGIGAPAHPEGDVDDVQLAFLRRHLDPAATTADDDGPPVRLFTMGRNRWRDEPTWPLARARDERWHLGAGGTLAPAPPVADGAPSTFAYDPADPVPTVGGAVAMVGAVPPGAFDQVRVETRDDVLVFTSEPLDRELEVTGRVKVVLQAASSAPSTDWVARLCDVHPDGRSYNVCDGIVRIAEGADRLQQVEIDLWSTSIAFLAGHRLRVQVTSSNFPRWDRNLNTGDQRAPRHAVAQQRVHHDAQHASWIELPVVER